MTIKMMAFGLTVAITIDVVLVRFLLAPAVMSMLGEKAWTMPAWLDRLLPNVALKGSEDNTSATPKDRPAVTRTSAPQVG